MKININHITNKSQSSNKALIIQPNSRIKNEMQENENRIWPIKIDGLKLARGNHGVDRKKTETKWGKIEKIIDR